MMIGRLGIVSDVRSKDVLLRPFKSLTRDLRDPNDARRMDRKRRLAYPHWILPQTKTPDRPSPPPVYDEVRREDIRRKHVAEPDPIEWQDAAAQDAGVPRFGEI